jgi:DNA mismatch repair protein MutL
VSRIRILSEQVANKIAAGEVVERPASVVKELLENAIDAGAKSIHIEVESGGKRLIRVTDDGCGMMHDDALLAFERHATSKLRTVDDLLSIPTLGFRGEALPTIAAVSRLTLETRTETEAEGTRVEFAGGKLISVKPAGVPAGTSISVADLFYSVPARRKFLKSETTELGHIASLTTHYALANPDRQFVLKTPTQEILNAAPVTVLSERIYQVLGREALRELVEIPPAEGPVHAAITEPEMGAEETTAMLRVSGFTSRPEVQRSNRNGIYLFVNRRLVRDKLLLHGINEAYRNIQPPGVFPCVLLFLELPYAEVDVNVHPAKVEVRFRHPQFVHDFVRDAIRLALAQTRAVPGFPSGRAAGAPPTASPAAGANAGAVAGPDGGLSGALGNVVTVGPPHAVIPTSFEEVAGMIGGFDLTNAPDAPIPQRLPFEGGSYGLPPGNMDVGVGLGEDSGRNSSTNDPSAVGADRTSATQLAEEPSATLPGPEGIVDLKPLGQVRNSFIVAINAEGLWIIDQHVAHERVLFEQHLRARRAGAVTGQRMLAPIVVELSPRQIVIFDQIEQELQSNGFDAERMGGRSVAIQAAPSGISTADAERLLNEILDGAAGAAQAISIESLQAQIAASTACHAAIKVNMPLDLKKMQWLLGELARTEYPMSCPHGRPVVLRYSMREIERAFKRV